MCRRMFPEEADNIEKFIGGFPDIIHGSVMASKPKTMQDAVEFATELMDKKIHTFAKHQTENKKKQDDNQLQENKKQNTSRAYTTRPREKKPYRDLSHCALNATITMVVRVLPNATSATKNQGHFRSDCPELKNQNHVNQAEGIGKRKMELLPYGMLLTRLFKHVVSIFSKLAIDRYILHDRVMHPFTPLYERKTQSDCGMKRPRELNASSSSTTLNHPSSFHPLNDPIDENDDESFHFNRSSPSQYISSSSNDVSRIVRYMKSIDLSIEISLSPWETNWAIGRPKAMMDEHRSSGPVLYEMNPATISSGLVQKSSSSTPFVPPSRNDWDLLFQPMFDELLNPLPSVDHQAAQVIASIAEVISQVQDDLTGSPSSTTVDQDAPSMSKSHTTTEIQSSVIPQEVKEDNLDIEVAHIGNDPLLGVPIIEVTSAQSSSTDKEGKAVDPSHYRGIIGTLLYLTASRLQISQSPRGIFINQSKYAFKSLKKYGFESCDPVDTPLVEKSKLDEDKEGKAVDPSHYRVFADADHAGCQDTRRSTSGSV
nr:copia protein [Tanacetum cinerariifolium]